MSGPGLANWSNLQPTLSPSPKPMDDPPPAYGSAPPNPLPCPTPQVFQPQPISTIYPVGGRVGYNGNHTVHVVQLSSPPPILGTRSSRIICPHCKADVETSVNYEPGRATHLFAGAICASSCFCSCCVCCVCVPYLINNFKDVDHFCPHCKQHVGNFRR